MLALAFSALLAVASPPSLLPAPGAERRFRIERTTQANGKTSVVDGTLVMTRVDDGHVRFSVQRDGAAAAVAEFPVNGGRTALDPDAIGAFASAHPQEAGLLAPMFALASSLAAHPAGGGTPSWNGTVPVFGAPSGVHETVPVAVTVRPGDGGATITAAGDGPATLAVPDDAKKAVERKGREAGLVAGVGGALAVGRVAGLVAGAAARNAAKRKAADIPPTVSAQMHDALDAALLQGGDLRTLTFRQTAQFALEGKNVSATTTWRLARS